MTKKLKKLFKAYKYEIGCGEFDRIFPKRHFDRQEYITFLFMGYFLAIVDMFFVVLVIQSFIEGVWWFGVEMAIAILISAIVATNERLQKARDLHKRLKKAPKIIQENAKLLYGNDWRESAIECYEAHIAGDCPLCGAV